MTKNFCHSWSFCPFFLISQGVPFKDQGSLNGTLSEFLKKMIRSCKICFETAQNTMKQGKLNAWKCLTNYYHFWFRFQRTLGLDWPRLSRSLSVCLSVPPHETICSRIQNFFKFGMWIRYDTNSLNPSAHQNRRTFTMYFGLFS